MEKNNLFVASLLVMVIGCTNGENDPLGMGSLDPPNLPQEVSYDLNNDGKDDISFKFGSDDVVTDGAPGYVGYIYPLNEALLYVPNQNEKTWVLDNVQNDIIMKGESTTHTWYPSNLGFMDIDDSPQGIWPVEWHLSSQKPSNPYYLGIQVKENDDFLIGWIKLSIDKKTAIVELLEHELALGDMIEIDQ